ncbi:hypothetical protein GCM10018793_11440 [Streptomyces sulfonofaciens]|uniref:Regulatory protein n=1 Tax=Streptomyces sulfonofaciens TaxID=68272 RepID=A0A919FVR7_9ACTN|nr:hypothetical protein [Streptomyces sulfonofaciens]GHH73190.1 hypothetical protein GCM10018793_11440 [Streptomyces sulfonofaciens]
MPDKASDNTNLKTQYAEQVATDLENNTKEQERIGAEISALQSHLGELERDHTLLVSMQQTLASGPTDTPADTPTGDTASSDAPSKARLPHARRSKDGAEEKGAKGAGAGAGRQSTNAKAGGQAKPAAKEAEKEPADRKGTPTLREVVSALLAAHDEPRSAAEVTSALEAAHPERKVSPTVVRNTLEALVAKGQAHRSKQQKSVFYSAVRTASGTSSRAGSGTASKRSGEGAGA